MSLAETMDQVARGVEVVGIVTLVPGLMIALLRGAGVLVGGRGAEEAYRVVRTVFGRSILLGLEFLSFSPEVEIDGTWPWRRAAVRQAGD